MAGVEALLEIVGPSEQFLYVHSAQLRNVFAVDEEVQSLLVEAGAPAFGTHFAGKELTAPSVGTGTGVFVLLQLDIFQQPVKPEIELRE